MFPLPERIIAVLAPFARLLSATVWKHAQVLVVGALLCQRPRPVAAALQVMGLGQEPLQGACRSELAREGNGHPQA